MFSGCCFPNPHLPTISGPPKPENDMTNVWGSAVGFLVSWEPFDFGLRRANVEVAEAGRVRADAAVERTRLDVATAAADAYLTYLAAQQTLRRPRRNETAPVPSSEIVGALVNSDLRPGADASRSRADVAASETQVIQAERAVNEARIVVEQMTGLRRLDSGNGSVRGASPGIGDGSAATHPLLLESSRPR